MALRRFSKKTNLVVSGAEAFSWHMQDGAFARLLPAWDKIKILKYPDKISDNSRVELFIKIFGPIGFKWLLEHSDYLPGKQFCDLQISGPFSFYKHQHLFSENNGNSTLEDLIEYSLPLAFILDRVAAPLIENRLERTFRYRHRITTQDLSIHAQYRDKPKLRFLISGATGMIGKSLCAFLTTGGHQVTRIVRSIKQAKAGDIILGQKGEINIPNNSQFDCVVNLAGAGIADKRWNKHRKQILIDSRVQFTKNLIVALKQLSTHPKTMISASGIGEYGDVKNNYPDENAARGTGFLAELCELWEAAAAPIEEAGCRLIKLRLGAVLSASGGALSKMLLPFTLGLGGKLGKGTQQFGWVALDDVLSSILFISQHQDISGAVNLVAPARTTNSEFVRALGKVLNRPTFFSMPASILRIIFGEISDEVLLASSTANPSKLINAGFKFLYEDIEKAIRAALGQKF